MRKRGKISGKGTHVSKVAREHVKGHRRSSLGHWDGCQDREENANVNDADSATDDKLEANSLGRTAVRAQCRQKTSPDNGEDPANVYRDQIFARLLDRNARHECDQADAIR